MLLNQLCCSISALASSWANLKVHVDRQDCTTIVRAQKTFFPSLRQPLSCNFSFSHINYIFITGNMHAWKQLRLPNHLVCKSRQTWMEFEMRPAPYHIQIIKIKTRDKNFENIFFKAIRSQMTTRIRIIHFFPQKVCKWIFWMTFQLETKSRLDQSYLSISHIKTLQMLFNSCTFESWFTSGSRILEEHSSLQIWDISGCQLEQEPQTHESYF